MSADDVDPVDAIDGLARRSDVLVPEWAVDVRIGDVLRVETPVGVLDVEVIGFAEVDDYYGRPAVLRPDELAEHVSGVLLTIRESDVVEVLQERRELRADGGRDRGDRLDPVEAAERLQEARDRLGDELEPHGLIRCGLCLADGHEERARIELDGVAHPFDVWQEHVHEVHQEGGRT